MRRLLSLLALIVLAGLVAWQEGILPPDRQQTTTPGGTHAPLRLPTFLPPEATPVVERILRSSPHPHRQDGGTFQNRERRLPSQPMGYYREYTVPTPGARDRGARRIVAGGNPPVDFWYTDDHYRSFRPFEARP